MMFHPSVWVSGFCTGVGLVLLRNGNISGGLMGLAFGAFNAWLVFARRS